MLLFCAYACAAIAKRLTHGCVRAGAQYAADESTLVCRDLNEVLPDAIADSNPNCACN